MSALPRIEDQQPSGRISYVDLQKGHPLIFVLAVTSFLTFCSTWFVRPPYVATFLLIPQLAALICFCTLFIRVWDGYLCWQYGPGWIRGRVLLADIVTTHILITPFAYGWGFLRTPSGWKFRSKGALAVEIRTRDGKRFRLGTMRAHMLQHVIERERRRRCRNS